LPAAETDRVDEHDVAQPLVRHDPLGDRGHQRVGRERRAGVVAGTDDVGQNPVAFITWKVPLGAARNGPQQAISSQLRGTFQFTDTAPTNSP
jgi:hypothetical protein